MQISKALLMFCACVLAAGLSVHAQDNAAQATARQALAAKLFEMDAQNPPATNAPAAAPAPKAKPAPVVKTKPAPAPKSSIDDMPPAKTVPSNGPVMVPVGGDAKADAAQKKADAKKAAAIKAQEDAAAKAQAKADAEKSTIDAKAQAKADADKAAADAKAKKLADKEAKKQHDAEVAAAEKQAKLNTDAAMKPPQPAAVTMPDMVAPPAPINATKQQQLADLLSKYRADQITPDEYQKQRADILAQP